MLKQEKIFLLILIGFTTPVFSRVSDSAIEIPEVSLSLSDSTYQTDLSSGQIKSLNRKEIQKNAPLNLSELLSQQTTVQVGLNSGSNSQYTLSLRGFGDNAPANALILIDGFPLMNASLLPPEFNALLLSDIENIHIFQGSEGSLWGNQATGGVLDIETREPSKPFGNLEIGYGSHQQIYTSGIYGNHWGNDFQYKFSGMTNTTDNSRVHNHYDQHQFSAEQIFHYETGSFHIKEKIVDNSQDFPGGLSLSQFENNPSTATDLEDYINAHTQIYQLLNQQVLNNYWMLETRFSHSQITRNGFFFSPFTENDFLNWFNPKLIGNFQHIQWILGGVLQNNGFETFGPPGDSSIVNANEQDVYGQGKLSIKHWEITLGSRFARQQSRPQLVIGQPLEYSDHVFVSEEGLAYHINQYWKAFLRRDGNFRFPKANEEVWLPVNVTQLKPQTGVSFETGLDYQSIVQQFQLSLYRLSLKNEIAFDPTQTPLQPFGATHNFFPTLRKGISVAEKVALTRLISIDSGLDYVDARFDSGPDAGKIIPAVPTWSANAGVNIEFCPKWKMSYEESYHGSSYASNDILNQGRKAFVYWIGDWSIQYLANHMNIAFKIKNIFNQRYSQYTLFNTSSQNNLYYPGLGRTALLSVSFNLS